MTIRILLVDDHQTFRTALRMTLELSDDIQVIGEAASGREAIVLVGRDRPDVVCMDLNMPGLSGIDTTYALLKADPTLKVIALSAHTDPQQVAPMLDAGAIGYVIKQRAGDELLGAIYSAMENQRYISPSLRWEGAAEQPALPRPRPTPMAIPGFSQRETAVLSLLASGASSSQIADQLAMAPAMVEVHQRNMLERLNINDLAALSAFARERISLDH